MVKKDNVIDLEKQKKEKEDQEKPKKEARLVQELPVELYYAEKFLNNLNVIRMDCTKDVVTFLDKRASAKLTRDVKSLVRNKIEAMDFNYNKTLLNCKNGIYNAEKGELIPFKTARKQNIYFSQMTNTEYDPTAKAPVFAEFMKSFNTKENPNFSNDFLSMVAYALFSPNNQKFSAFLIGVGNDGKTTLQSALAYTLGDYAKEIQTSALKYVADRRFNPSIEDMNRARYMFASELNENTLLDHSLFKKITSETDATMPYEKKGSNHISRAVISGVLTLDSNHMPLLAEADQAVLNRIATFYFSKSIDPEKMDKSLGDKLKKEASGILNIIIAHYDKNWEMPKKYFEETTKRIADQTIDKEEFIKYEIEQNYIVTNHEQDMIRQPKIHQLYSFKQNGIKPKDIKSLLEKAFNVTEKKSNGNRYYLGIKEKNYN